MPDATLQPAPASRPAPQAPPAPHETPQLDPARFFLPVGYTCQTSNRTLDTQRDAKDGAYWAPWRVKDAARWQRHVYALAARTARQIIRARTINNDPRPVRVLDVGCGVCVKLSEHLIPTGAHVVGIDQDSALAVARNLGCRAELHPVNLESPTLDPALDLNGHFDIILCADVLEHLVNPDHALNFIRRCAHAHTRIILSTPERHRERGRACMASLKPEHVREWAFAEFAAYVTSRGFHIARHMLCTKDQAPILPARRQERDFRRNLSDRSPLSCQVIVATLNADPGEAP